MIILDAVQGSPEWHRARLGIPTASGASNILAGGGRPKMPTYYRPVQDASEPAARAPKQREIFHSLLSLGRSPVESSPSRDALLKAGKIEPCDPPPDAQPVYPPITLSAQRDAYMNRLLAERITGQPADEFGGTRWTEHGHDCEGEAAAYFVFETGFRLRHVGLVYRDEAREVACSPDALVLDPLFEQDPDPFPTAGLELKCPAAWTHIGWLREHARTGEMPYEHVAQVQFSLWVTGLPRWYLMSYAAPIDGQSWSGSLPPLLVEVEPDPRWQAALDEHVPAFLAELRVALEGLT